MTSNQSLTTMLPVTEFFVRKAGQVFARIDKRVGDMKFFMEILGRLKKGIPLDSNMAAFKNLDKDLAIESLNALIKKCKDEIKQGDWEINSKKVISKVKTEFLKGEPIPRYTVDYKFNLNVGEVSIRVETSGITTEVYINTKKCKGVSEEKAHDAVMDEILLSGLR